MSRFTNSIIMSNTDRLLSLDIFRGITIAAMILVNTQDSDIAPIYSQLQHSEWNGCTIADLVYPFFLYIVGVAIPFSIFSRVSSGEDDKKIIYHVLKRSLIIFALGLFLNRFPYHYLSSIRIPGVLQRIALCYFFASLAVLKLKIKDQITIAILLLILYWALMIVVPVPGYGPGVFEIKGNLAAYIDTQ